MNPETIHSELTEIKTRLGHLESMMGGGPEISLAGWAVCPRTGCAHKQQLKQTLLETIEALDESRKAFRSRQLELLRKKLTAVLAEIA